MRQAALDVGFPGTAAEELRIVASELATNILKYGVRGALEVEAISDAIFGVGIRLVAEDEGPPFHDVREALLDGHDDRGPLDPAALAQRKGLGGGLGAVARLTDSFEVISRAPAAGKRIVVRRWRRGPCR